MKNVLCSPLIYSEWNIMMYGTVRQSSSRAAEHETCPDMCNQISFVFLFMIFEYFLWKCLNAFMPKINSVVGRQILKRVGGKIFPVNFKIDLC